MVGLYQFLQPSLASKLQICCTSSLINLVNVAAAQGAESIKVHAQAPGMRLVQSHYHLHKSMWHLEHILHVGYTPRREKIMQRRE